MTIPVVFLWFQIQNSTQKIENWRNKKNHVTWREFYFPKFLLTLFSVLFIAVPPLQNVNKAAERKYMEESIVVLNLPFFSILANEAKVENEPTDSLTIPVVFLWFQILNSCQKIENWWRKKNYVTWKEFYFPTFLPTLFNVLLNTVPPLQKCHYGGREKIYRRK